MFTVYFVGAEICRRGIIYLSGGRLPPLHIYYFLSVICYLLSISSPKLFEKFLLFFVLFRIVLDSRKQPPNRWLFCSFSDLRFLGLGCCWNCGLGGIYLILLRLGLVLIFQTLLPARRRIRILLHIYAVSIQAYFLFQIFFHVLIIHIPHHPKTPWLTDYTGSVFPSQSPRKQIITNK